MRIGDRVLLSGGYNESAFRLPGVIENLAEDPRNRQLVIYVAIDNGSHHYGYIEQVELIEPEQPSSTNSK